LGGYAHKRAIIATVAGLSTRPAPGAVQRKTPKAFVNFNPGAKTPKAFVNFNPGAKTPKAFVNFNPGAKTPKAFANFSPGLLQPWVDNLQKVKR
jgi:hypothetical protein